MIMEVLRFIFQDFVHFVGSLILIYAFFEGIAKVLLALRGIEQGADE